MKLYSLNQCWPNIIDNGIVVFQHDRHGFVLTRHRYCGGYTYAIEVKSTSEEWSSYHTNYTQITGRGGGFRGRGTLRAGCSADTHWSVPLVKKGRRVSYNTVIWPRIACGILVQGKGNSFMELSGWAYFKKLRYLFSPLAATSQRV